MGTRHLTAVYINGEYKVAQYGQWDGYPEGQGMTCLNFARRIADKIEREKFAAKVRAAQWITEAEADAINRRIESGELENWQEEYPALTRDTGSEILNVVMNAPDGIKLNNEISFAADSLFCEWAWVIDLDAGTFEGFKGFNTDRPLTPEDRFYFLRNRETANYHCVILKAKWSLDSLPTDEDFLAAFKEPEELPDYETQLLSLAAKIANVETKALTE